MRRLRGRGVGDELAAVFAAANALKRLAPRRFPRAAQRRWSATVFRPRFPTALPPVWNVPYGATLPHRPRAGAGRLAEQLGAAGATAVTRACRGPGGGQDRLAVEYAYRHRARFDIVWWVRAEEPATLVGDYADLAGALGLAEAAQADRRLAGDGGAPLAGGHDRWLLILDNAEAPCRTGLRRR